MVTKPDAIGQIAEIYAVIQKQFMYVVSGRMLIVLGSMIAMIPLFEQVMQTYVDPVLVSFGFSSPMIFALRTVCYWVPFALIGKRFASKVALHPALQRAFQCNYLYPIIPVATSGMLALTGHTSLIMPIVLIFVGVLLGFLGNFTNNIIHGLAAAHIVLGISSIYLASLKIPHFMMMLIFVQGFMYVVAGIVLQMRQRAIVS